MADPPSVGSGQPCGPEKFELERMPPEIVIVLDRSSSMSATDNRMTTRWAEATAALDDTLRSTEATVHWGLKMFPSMSGCGVTPGLDEGVRRESHAAITDRITTAGHNSPFDNERPTPTAVKAAVDYLRARTTKNPKAIVLITDGEPTCNLYGLAGGDREGAVAAIEAGVAAGFTTYVIGIATDGSVASVTLDMMAVAGAAPRTDMPRYHPVNTHQDLITILNMIAGRAATCVFSLSKAPASSNAAVRIDGMVIPKDVANGWSYDAAQKSLQLNGSTCERLKGSQTVNVSITFGCPPLIIP